MAKCINNIIKNTMKYIMIACKIDQNQNKKKPNYDLEVEPTLITKSKYEKKNIPTHINHY